MKEHLLNLRKLNIRTVNEEWTRIIGGFECLLEQEESLHHARLARTIRASEDGQGPDLNRLLCVNRFESADRDSRDGSAGCSRPDLGRHRRSPIVRAVQIARAVRGCERCSGLLVT